MALLRSVQASVPREQDDVSLGRLTVCAHYNSIKKCFTLEFARRWSGEEVWGLLWGCSFKLLVVWREKVGNDAQNGPGDGIAPERG